MKRLSASLFAAACVAAASAAQALPKNDDKLSFELFASGNVAMPGSFRGQTTPFQSPGTAGTVTYGDLRFDDAYAHRVGGGAELAYSFDDHLSTFARASYNEFGGDRVDIGKFEPAGSTASHPITADFGDTATREFDLGARYMFLPWGKVSPFAGAALGATHLSATRASIGNLNGIGDSVVELGAAKTVFSQRAELGVQYAPMRNFDLRLTAAADHVDNGQKANDANLALLGLDNVRGDVRGHWDYPLELGGVWRF